MEHMTIVRVREGLHARPATQFVKLAKQFESNIELVSGEKAVSAKSAVKLMLLAVKENQPITVRTNGSDAAAAMEALIDFLENPDAGLDAEAQATSATHGDAAAPPSSVGEAPQPEVSSDGVLKGIPASDGLALGRVFAYFPPNLDSPARAIAEADIEQEITRLREAIAAVQARMQASLKSGTLSPSDHGIISALSDLAGDEVMTAEMVQTIRFGNDAVTAVRAVTEGTSQAFANMVDVYFNARADDVLAIGRQITLALLGKEDANLSTIPDGTVLVAEDIGAFDLAQAPLKRIAGIICGRGGATSHIAIIARTHGIPAVVGLGDAVHRLRDIVEIGLDGGRGNVWPDPKQEVRADLAARLQVAERERQDLTAFRDLIPTRQDGTVIEVAANLGSLEEIDAARASGAMGVGLFRTELLFMRQRTLPTEDAQFEMYRTLAEAFYPQPVIVRTLDVGGDKPVGGIHFPQEENPFLGWRGIRMCLDRPDIFKPQLKALLRAAIVGNVKVMLPMVSLPSEVRRTRQLIEECRAEIDAEGKPHGAFQLGVMIETPAAVFIADQLAQEVDFFSIGTNDLTQYVMAADRLNASVSNLNDAGNDAVMAAIEMTARAGVKAGIMVGMCGEAAGNPALIPRFMAMGLTELSMSPTLIPRAKKCVAECGV
jgi:phosphoenolpyruvate-protein phosphotransferase